MDNDGLHEIAVGWQMSGSLRHMTLHAAHGLRYTQIAEADYTALALCDLTGDERVDIAAIQMHMPGGTCAIVSLMDDGEVVRESAAMSADAESVSRVLTGKLADGSQGLFVDVTTANNMMTDIFAYKEGVLKNVVLRTVSGSATVTGRTPATNATDINRDGIVEIPSIVPAPRPETARSKTEYHTIDWYSYDRYGVRIMAMTTYHNWNDGWYFVLPEKWRGAISVRREDRAGEREVVFSHVKGEDFTDFMSVFMLTGENREERAGLPGRFTLLIDGAAIYAARIDVEAASAMTETEVRQRFMRIYNDWEF
jgi:hypothetical protein